MAHGAFSFRILGLFLVALLLAALMGCGGGNAAPTTQTTPPPPDFAISATPASQSVVQGNSGSYTVNVTASGGFSGTANFSVTGMPSGATATFNPASVSTSGASTLTVATAAAAAGTYPLTITGTSGSLTHSISVTLVVTTPPPPPPPPTPTEFIYATAGELSNVYAFKIDYSNGHLSAVAGSPFTVQVSTQDQSCKNLGCRVLTADPLGKFLFEAYNGQTPGVVSFMVDANSGVLTQDDFRSPSANILSTDPQGRFLYGPDGQDSNPSVTAYDVNRSDGTLSPAPGMPYPYPAQATPMGEVDPLAISNNFAYVITRCTSPCSNDFTSHINGFSIDQKTGALTPLPSSPFVGGQLMTGLAIHPSGKFLYSVELPSDEPISTATYQLVGFGINADGSLTRLPNSQPAHNNGAFQLIVSPNGAFLYRSSSDVLYSYSIDPTTGALTPTGAFVMSPLGDSTGWVAIDPTVKYVYIGGHDNAINAFTVNPATGAITFIGEAYIRLPEFVSTVAIVKTQ